MASENLFWFPIITVLWFPVTFLITYIVAVKLDHVAPVFPYISDTGTVSPESCIFGQLLNMASALVAVDIYLRYKQIKEVCCQYTTTSSLARLNVVSMWMGYIMSLGISLVANFQETNVIQVHLIGALAAFGIGSLYFCMQTVISYKTCPWTCTRRVCHLRCFLSVSSAVLFFLTFGCASVSLQQFKGDNKLQWSPNDPGFSFHIASTISEWLTALVFCLFISTFAHEFRFISCTGPKLALCIKEDLVSGSKHSSPITQNVDNVETGSNMRS